VTELNGPYSEQLLLEPQGSRKVIEREEKDAERPLVRGTSLPALGILVCIAALLLRPAEAQLSLINLGHVNEGGLAQSVAITGHYAFLANYGLGLVVYDVSDPAQPTSIAKTNDVGIATGITLSGNYAYLANGPDGLRIYDISSPTNPINVGHFASTNSSARASAVDIQGHYAYVAYGADGLRVFDISDPANPAGIGQAKDGGAEYVAVSGNYACVTSPNVNYTFRIYDVTDPANPTNVYRSGFGYAFAVAMSGNRAYVQREDLGTISIYDLSDPRTPVELSRNHVPGSCCTGAALSNDYFFLANSNDGLRVLNVANPTNVVEVGHANDALRATAVAVSGSYVYLANNSDGLRIYAMAPQLTGTITSTNTLLFTWPAPAPFVLQQTADLNSAKWGSIQTAPSTSEGRSALALSPPAGRMFYRLVSR